MHSCWSELEIKGRSEIPSTVCWHERTHSCTSICLFSGMSDSEVSPEAELGKTSAKHPPVVCVKEAEETLNEDEKEESVDSSRGADGEDEVMYDIGIDTDDENAEGSDGDVRREDEVSWSGHEEACSDPDAACMSGSVDDEGHRIKQQAEAPEQREESRTESKVIFQLVLDGPALSVCGCFGGGGLIAVLNICSQFCIRKKSASC